MKTIIIKKLKCERCGHQWVPTQPEIRICPKCKSPYWDVPRKSEKKGKKSFHKGKADEPTEQRMIWPSAKKS